jgi:hypothetical protein
VENVVFSYVKGVAYLVAWNSARVAITWLADWLAGLLFVTRSDKKNPHPKMWAGGVGRLY